MRVLLDECVDENLRKLLIATEDNRISAPPQDMLILALRYATLHITEANTMQVSKARVFMSGRSQAVRIPAEFRFTTDEVYLRRDPQSGDLILSQAPATWEQVYSALDNARFPNDFLADRNQGSEETREDF